MDGISEIENEETVTPKKSRTLTGDGKFDGYRIQGHSIPVSRYSTPAPHRERVRDEGKIPSMQPSKGGTCSGSGYSSMQDTDFLRRLQRLEEMQHLKSMEVR